MFIFTLLYSVSKGFMKAFQTMWEGFRRLFRALSNICDGTFCETSGLLRIALNDMIQLPNQVKSNETHEQRVHFINIRMLRAR